MTTSLKPLKPSTKNITVTQVGCHFTGAESKWEVRYVTKVLKRAGRASQKGMADLYQKYPDIVADEYDPFRDDDLYSLGTIKVYASIFKNWPVEQRHWDLGISFYQAACPLPPDQREAVMNWVVTEGKGRDELRKAVALLTNGKKPELPPLKDDIIFDQTQQIFELENKVQELENGQESETSPKNYALVVDRIIRLLQELEANHPEGLKLIREYLGER